MTRILGGRFHPVSDQNPGLHTTRDGRPTISSHWCCTFRWFTSPACHFESLRTLVNVLLAESHYLGHLERVILHQCPVRTAPPQPIRLRLPQTSAAQRVHGTRGRSTGAGGLRVGTGSAHGSGNPEDRKELCPQPLPGPGSRPRESPGWMFGRWPAQERSKLFLPCRGAECDRLPP